jgi:hypothetical protein
MSRKDADDGDPGRGHDGSWNRQLKLERAGSTDDLVSLPGRMDAIGRKDSEDPAGALLRGLAAEIVEDRPKRPEHVFAAPAPNLDAHTFSSGA